MAIRQLLGPAILALAFLLVLDALLFRTGAFFHLAAYDLLNSSEYPSHAIAVLAATKRSNVVMVGSSRVAHAFRPDLIDEALRRDGWQSDSLNGGIPGGDSLSTYLYVRRYLVDDALPRVLVYGVADFELNANAGRHEEQYKYLATPADLDLVVRHQWRDLDALLEFPVYAFWRLPAFRVQLIEAARRVALSGRRDPSQAAAETCDEAKLRSWSGFLPAANRLGGQHITSEIQADFDAHSPTDPGGPLDRYTVGGEGVAWFEAALALARERGVQVVVVNMPTSTYWRARLTRSDQDTYTRQLRELADRYALPYLDYQADPVMDDEKFSDAQHVNKEGARVLSDRLSYDLERLLTEGTLSIPRIAAESTHPPGDIICFPPLLAEQNYKGFNLVSYGERLYAIRQTAGPFLPAAADRGEYPSGLSMTELKRVVDPLADALNAAATANSDSPVLVEEGHAGYNIVRVASLYYGLRQAQGPFDSVAALRGEYWVAQSLNLLKREIALAGALDREQQADWELANDPALVWPNYQGFNLVRFGRRTYAVPQDGSTFSQALAEEQRYLAADSAATLEPRLDVRATAQLEASADQDPGVPYLVEEADSGYNLVRFQKRTFALRQTQGEFDFGRFRAGAYPGALEGASAGEIRALLPPPGLALPPSPPTQTAGT